MSRRRCASRKQCEAITKASHRCGVTTAYALHHVHGRCVAEPLRSGGRTCAFHLELFGTQTIPFYQCDSCIIWLDFEVSGLDVLRDEILEVALPQDQSNAQFATTVRPICFPDGPPGIHVSGQDDLLSIHHFSKVFPRKLLSLNSAIGNSLAQSDWSSDEDATDNSSLRLASFWLVTML